MTVQLVPIQTGDGSYTFYNVHENIYFRSLQGAREEARYVFLEGTHLLAQKPDWQVLELGLGPGMNFLVTAEAFLDKQPGGCLRYHVVENAPLEAARLNQLHYSQWLKEPQLFELLKSVLEQAKTNSHCQAQFQNIELVLYHCSWDQVALPPKLKFQALYHDPFGPAANPEGWNQACFDWEAQALSETGILATYGAATAVRKAMAKAGLHLASRKGSGNKREMTLAAKNAEVLSDYNLLLREKYLK